MRLAAMLVVVGACFRDPRPPPVVAPVAPPHVPAPVAPDPDAPLAPVEGARIGTLANGLTYYIVEPTGRGTDHDDRMYAALAVRAGSLDETDAEAGAAHLLAHLAAPVLGLPPEGEADTSLIATTYTVPLYTLPEDGEPVAADSPAIDPARALDRALARMHRVVDGELPVDNFAALRERLHRTPRTPGLLAHELAATARTRHPADNAPNEHYGHLTLDSVLAFRHTWYRADRIAVVVVTEDDPAEILHAIEQHFGSLPKPKTPMPERPAAARATPPHPAFAVELAAPAEQRPGWFTQRVPHASPRGERGQRALVIEDILERVLRQRRNAATPRDAIRSWEQFYAFAPGTDLYTIPISQDGLESARTFTRELARVRAHGVTAEELAAEVHEIVDGAKVAGAAHDWNPDRLAAFIDHFVAGEPPPSPAFAKMIERIAATITPADIAAEAVAFAMEGRTLELPESSAGGTPAEAIARELLALDAAPVEPWDQRIALQPFYAQPPAAPARAIVKTEVVKTATIWTLANGAHVVVQPTKRASAGPLLPGEVFGTRDLSIEIEVPIGWARLDAQAALALRAASEYLGADVFGDRPTASTRAILAERRVFAVFDMRAMDSHIWVGSSGGELDTMFQVAHAIVAGPAPRVDPEAVAKWRIHALGEIAEPGHVAANHREAELDAARGVWTPPELDADELARVAADPARGAQAFRDVVGDAVHPTFMIVGPQPELVRPFVERYLAATTPAATRHVLLATPRQRPPTVGLLPSVVLVPKDGVRELVVEYVAAGTGDPVRDLRDAQVAARALETSLGVLFDTGGAVFRAQVAGGIADDGRLTLRVDGTNLPGPVQASDFDVVEHALAALATRGPDPQWLATLQRTAPANLSITEVQADAFLAVRSGKDTAKAIAVANDPTGRVARFTAPLIEATARRFGRWRVRLAIEPVM